MKKILIKISFGALMAVSLFSCKKDTVVLSPVEKYLLIGTVDAGRTTIIPAPVVTKAEFIITYNAANSFGDAQSVLSGTLNLTGFVVKVDTVTTKFQILDATTNLPLLVAGIPDSNVTRSFLATNLDLFGQSGASDISYISVITSKTVTYKTSTAVASIPNSSGLFGNYANAYYTYNNNPAASFVVSNMPFTNEITNVLKDGKGYIRLGRKPNFIFINLDQVVKIP
jgi:hypothetical protein